MSSSKRDAEFGPVGSLAEEPVDLLVCFAVKEEAKFFLPGPEDDCQVWLTGMGRKNAVESIRKALSVTKPERVITAGFAGGLNPALQCGTVLYDEDYNAGFGSDLEKAGARPGSFHCHRRVAITVEEKAALWKTTGKDAVEMESSVIRNICRDLRIPSATIRVISDDASQDLPLDFNALMTAGDRIHYPKLIWKVISSPRTIPKLIDFQRQTFSAAKQLGTVLEKLLHVQKS